MFVHKSIKLSFVGDVVEVEGFAWTEDCGVVGKVPVAGIIEAV